MLVLFVKKKLRQVNALTNIWNWLDVSAWKQFMIALWLEILIISLVCGISVEQQITKKTEKLQERCWRSIYKDYE